MFQLDKNQKMVINNTSSILGPELEIHGDVKVSGSLLLYGKVYGNIHSNGSVRTADGSEVKGNILANEVMIGGMVDGDVDVKNKVTLGNSSNLTGNLKAATLTIEEGAQFEGVCNMNNKPQKQKLVNIEND